MIAHAPPHVSGEIRVRTRCLYFALPLALSACANNPSGTASTQPASLGDAGISALDAATGAAPGPAPTSDLAEAGASKPDGAEPAPTSVRCMPGELADLSIDALTNAGPFAVANTDLTLEDTSRPTPAHADDPGADTRQLPTTVWYPADNSALGGVLGPRAVAEGGPFPLVIYAHGFNLNSDAGQYLGEHLASHGFIVAAPDFPLSQQNAPGGPTFDDLVNQPGDLSFVIDAMLEAHAGSEGLFSGAIDAARIAVVGYSLGGSTAMLLGHHPTLADQRISAIVSLAGIHAMLSPAFFRFRPLPALVMHGDLDAIVPYAPNAQTALSAGRPDVHLVSIRKGTHVGFASLPLEPVVVGVGGLIAPQGSDPNNVDGLGCGTVQDLIPRDNAYLTMLGGAASGIVEPVPLDPCKLEQLGQPALAAPDQRGPTKRAVLAFLRAYLAVGEESRAAHCTFLEQELGKAEGLTVE